MNPSGTENPAASTPKTPAARSPSSKKPPSGVCRRTNISAVTATRAPTMRIAQTTFIAARPLPRVCDRLLGDRGLRCPHGRGRRRPVGGGLERLAPAGEESVPARGAEDRPFGHLEV